MASAGKGAASRVSILHLYGPCVRKSSRTGQRGEQATLRSHIQIQAGLAVSIRGIMSGIILLVFEIYSSDWRVDTCPTLPTSCPSHLPRFGAKLGLNCLELTGDCDPEAEEIDKADIICTTPEKFDAVTRRLNESGGASFFSEASMRII